MSLNYTLTSDWKTKDLVIIQNAKNFITSSSVPEMKCLDEPTAERASLVESSPGEWEIFICVLLQFSSVLQLEYSHRRS